MRDIELKTRFVLKFPEWMMQRCCRTGKTSVAIFPYFPPEHSQLDSPELVDRKPWNVWKALVLVQRNGVPSSNLWPQCLG